jgi:hypothetical protein
MVQNGRDCLWKRGLPNGEIDDCRMRFRSRDLKEPSLLCELLRHRSTMRRAMARATDYPQLTLVPRQETRGREARALSSNLSLTRIARASHWKMEAQDMWVDVMNAVIVPQVGTFGAVLLIQGLNLI